MSYRAWEVTAAAVAALVLAASCTSDDPAPDPTPPPRRVLTDVQAVEGTKAFGDPAALAFAANGDLWVGNYESSTLARYAPDQLTHWGAPKAATVIEGGAIKGPNSMVFDAHGYLWVAMYDGDRVAGFTPGDLKAGRRPSLVLPDPDGVLRKPAGVALDTEGNLWVSNAGVGHLVRYPREGGLEKGTAKPDVVVDVADEDCQAVAVHRGFLWLGCSRIDTVYAYKLPARSGRMFFARKDRWTRCGVVQFVPAPSGALAAACYLGSVRVFGNVGVASPPPLVARGAAAQILTNVHGIAYDATGALWAGTNYNVIVRFPADTTDNFPDLVLRPDAATLPSFSSQPVHPA